MRGIGRAVRLQQFYDVDDVADTPLSPPPPLPPHPLPPPRRFRATRRTSSSAPESESCPDTRWKGESETCPNITAARLV